MSRDVVMVDLLIAMSACYKKVGGWRSLRLEEEAGAGCLLINDGFSQPA